MTTSQKTQDYWIDKARFFAESRLTHPEYGATPQLDEFNAVMDDMVNYRAERDAAIARAERAEAACDRYEDALQEIDNWAKAYPLDIFPEPDFKRVREILEAAGITLDCVSASNMRHVIKGVDRIVSTALKGGEIGGL